jgi:endonuclease V
MQVDFNPQTLDGLNVIAGLDITTSTADDKTAIGSVTVCAFPSLTPLHHHDDIFDIPQPYIPSYLAFREVPIYLSLLAHLQTNCPHRPQLLLVDGNGIFHPRALGAASHLGVLADIPTVGVAKTFFKLERISLPNPPPAARPAFHRLVGESGRVWGSAFYATASKHPLVVSQGHRVTLDVAERVVRAACRHKVPEPIRLSDLRSRELMRGLERTLGLKP